MSELVKIPGLVQRPSTKKLSRQSAAKGLALVNQHIASLVEPLTISERCRGGVGRVLGGKCLVPDVRLLDDARKMHARGLSLCIEAKAALDALFGIVYSGLLPSNRLVDSETALTMLGPLFAALSKKKADASDENAAALLITTADMFSPLSNTLAGLRVGRSIISRHPVVLALAIKSMLTEQIFLPSPAEVFAAVKQAHQKVFVHFRHLSSWIEDLHHADRILFELDRPKWDGDYAGVGSDLVLAMRDDSDEGPGIDEDTDQPIPPSPRWQALNDLCNAKREAEQAE